jgi:hypothetical protein
MRPMPDHHATAEQTAAAAAVAARTRQAVFRYADIDAALRDGFAGPVAEGGTDVHLEHKKHQADGRTLDPDRPEMLVYPFGTCPAFSINMTAGEMMHVWTVDGPGGPYAEALDEAWIRTCHATHGRPFTGR